MKVKTVLVNTCRLLLALTFIFSGYVKAIDPLGTQYKIEDYLHAMGLFAGIPVWVILCFAVAISALEFTIGILLLFAIRRRLVSRIALLFLLFMTFFSLWSAIAEPVSDCGCFGDAVHLTPVQTFLKNIVLLVMALVISKWPLEQLRILSKHTQWIVENYAMLFILVSSVYSLYYLPQFDFRPYGIGKSIVEGMKVPEGKSPSQFETVFIMEKDGEKKEFLLDEYPDSTWTFIDTKTIEREKGYTPPIQDFAIQTMDGGEDITDDILSDSGYVFLLVSPYLEKASDANFGDINQLYDYAQSQGIKFIGLTASDERGVARWHQLTEADYTFYHVDADVLKTMIRSNPGLMLLRRGVIINKWSHNSLPTVDNLAVPFSQTALSQQPRDSVGKRLAVVLTWFIQPLLLITIADRAWEKYKNKNRKHNNISANNN